MEDEGQSGGAGANMTEQVWLVLTGSAVPNVLIVPRDPDDPNGPGGGGAYSDLPSALTSRWGGDMGDMPFFCRGRGQPGLLPAPGAVHGAHQVPRV